MGSYDYIVVGAGSAGAILAARLSENPATNVLLLEAGRDYPDKATMPSDLLDSRGLGSLEHDWNYVASPLPGRSIPYRRGKVVGGTSAINAAAAQWGRPSDFAEWVRRGNTAWCWENVEAIYRRLEADPDAAALHHGRDGPVPITRYADHELIPIQRSFRRACMACGLPPTDDHNGVDNGGVGPWPMNRRESTRISSALSHLSPARGRPNLTIRPECLVNRVVFNGSRVEGIQLAAAAGSEIIHANRVVLSAGAIGSPAILLRSGIGPKSWVEAIRTPMRLNMAGVGARLWDHAAVPIRIVPKADECVIGRDPRFQMMARFTTSNSRAEGDMMLVLVSHLDVTAMPSLRAEAGVPVVAVLVVALMAPNGHGKLVLSSNDPTHPPNIDLNFCTQPDDAQRLAEGLRLAWKIARSREMSGAYERIAGLDDAVVGDDDRLTSYIKSNVGTLCHACGTLPMGPGHDRLAVVDEECRLRGVDNVWIVDASVLPTIPSVVPNLTVMMIAERVADWLIHT